MLCLDCARRDLQRSHFNSVKFFYFANKSTGGSKSLAVRAICYSIAVCNSSVVAPVFIFGGAFTTCFTANKNSKAYATQHGMSFEAS